MPWGAAIAAGGSVLGGLIGGGASASAAKAQADAAKYAANLQYQMYQQTVQRLQPWTDAGTAAVKTMGGFLGLPGYSSAPSGWGVGSALQPFQPTMDQLSKTPGYQFTLQQGEQAATNSLAAMGLGSSGAAVKGAETFATGLASQTYQQQFNNYWSQIGQVYNMLSGVSQSGGSAAANQGQAGLTAGANIGNAVMSGAAAQASGIIGAGSAIGGAIQNASYLPFLQNALNQGQYSSFNPSPTGTYGGQQEYTGPTNTGVPSSYNF